MCIFGNRTRSLFPLGIITRLKYNLVYTYGYFFIVSTEDNEQMLNTVSQMIIERKNKTYNNHNTEYNLTLKVSQNISRSQPVKLKCAIKTQSK